MDFASTMEWRVCASAPTYEVSDCGDLRVAADADHRRAGKRLKGYINPDGYIAYGLLFSDKPGSLLSHVLVAEAFIGPRPTPLHEVAHGNGSRICNHWQNLRWATRKENDDDCALHGTTRRGEDNGRSTITDDDVRFIRRRYYEIKAERGRVADLDEQFGMSRSQIIRIAKRQAWGHVL